MLIAHPSNTHDIRSELRGWDLGSHIPLRPLNLLRYTCIVDKTATVYENQFENDLGGSSRDKPGATDKFGQELPRFLVHFITEQAARRKGGGALSNHQILYSTSTVAVICLCSKTTVCLWGGAACSFSPLK